MKKREKNLEATVWASSCPTHMVELGYDHHIHTSVREEGSVNAFCQRPFLPRLKVQPGLPQGVGFLAALLDLLIAIHATAGLYPSILHL